MTLKIIFMGTPEFSIPSLRLLNSNYDKFWNDVRKRYPITIERTRKYLTWRFLKHPLIDYHFLVLKNSTRFYQV